MNIDTAFRQWIEAGGERIGEISIARRHPGFESFHYADHTAGERRIFTKPEDAREIARFDDAGKYRPLKSAPNLRRGWLLRLANIEELRLALDFFYPAMIGSWLAAREQRLPAVDFRETAKRQSGMYAVVKKITDPEADTLIGRFCRSEGKCLKTILWKIDAGRAITSLPELKFDLLRADQLTGTRTDSRGAAIPLPCAEACNLLIAEARTMVKNPPP